MESADHEFFVETIALGQEADVILDPKFIKLTSDLYRTVPTKFKVNLVNRNQLCLDFKWDQPTGEDSKFAIVKCDPESGRLNRLGNQEVEITLNLTRSVS